jgi:hypothetical protein
MSTLQILSTSVFKPVSTPFQKKMERGDQRGNRDRRAYGKISQHVIEMW